MTGYCMKCKAKREIKDPVERTTPEGHRYADGRCVVCNTRLTRFLPKR